MSMRRSLLIGLGLDRGHGREQRVAAARGLRDQQIEGGADAQPTEESRRRRLRERFGIRTRRRGQEAAVAAEPTEATETSPMAERNSGEAAETHVQDGSTEARSS